MARQFRQVISSLVQRFNDVASGIQSVATATQRFQIFFKRLQLKQPHAYMRQVRIQRAARSGAICLAVQVKPEQRAYFIK